MRIVRRRIDAWAWLAGATLLALALLPAMGRALAQASDPTMEICTAGGMRMIAPADTGAAAPAAVEASADPACPFCAPGLTAWLPAAEPPL